MDLKNQTRKRELKFRVFDKILKEYQTPQGGDYSLGVLSGKVRGKYGEEFPEMIVEQYTGLKDKNGKEIFEGDIVQHDAWEYPFEVIFNQEKARFVCKMKTGLTQYIDNKRLKVVGNVYQNHDLLT